MANNFNFYSPTEVIFGKDTHRETGKYIRKYGGSRILILYGSERVFTTGLMGEITESIKKEGLTFSFLGGIVPNPHLSKVYEGIGLGREMQADFLLAVGGGSVIDTAKAVAYGLAEPEEDVWTLFEHTRTAKKCLPTASVLTIAAAGSETSMSAVITNEKTKEKRAYDDDLSRPRFAVMNPELTLSLSDYQTESGCTDILMHTMERYFTNGGNMEITDSIAEGLMRTVIANAVILHGNPQNYDARAEIMWAGSLAHNNLTGCGNDGGDFATHMLEHEIGGMFDVTHGAGLAAIWPSYARYVYRDALPRFVKFAVNVMQIEREHTDEETALKGIETMEKFYHDINMPTNMRELGVQPTDEQIHEMAVGAARACGGSKGSARVLYQDDMEKIYYMAR
ncbi:MAG: iron-containing alcohol dehydrogenase [Lachnospiraceae bacterium]|nr:iron-containing alcohol dehydrogenase [Lachnospiraceae bacterium]